MIALLIFIALLILAGVIFIIAFIIRGARLEKRNEELWRTFDGTHEN